MSMDIDLDKSTIVRSLNGPTDGPQRRSPKPRSLRSFERAALRHIAWTGWRALSLVMPEVAEERAALRFQTPRRVGYRWLRGTGGIPRPPVVPGLVSERFTIKSRGRSLAAWQWGTGPTVLLSHGWNGSGAQMRAFISPLVALGFRVVTFDQPAHGASEGERSNIADFCDAVLSAASDLEPVHAVIGHSLGATAIALALSLGLDAKRVVLLAPALALAPFVRAFASSLGFDRAAQERVLGRVQASIGKKIASLDVATLAPHMTRPALLVHDPADREVPFEGTKELARRWAGAKLLEIAGGHTGVLVAPSAVQAVVSFVEACADA
jgi:pimeloyl-ACP methyl ester carboxylesterase